MRTTHATRRPAGYPWHHPSGWWLKNNHYVLYMIRELTAVFAALWVVLFLGQIMANHRNADKWLTSFQNPGWLIFSVIAFVFVMYHSWTSFTATSTLLYLRMGKQAVPGSTLNGLMFVGWAVASIVIGVILLTPIFG